MKVSVFTVELSNSFHMAVEGVLTSIAVTFCIKQMNSLTNISLRVNFAS